MVSIWFDDPTRLATALGLVTAGLAFALQKVVTAVADYFVIMRGNTFNVGDRIVMGGVRGDVIALDFTQTTIMEMGQPPPVQGADPAMWVQSREYTGRVVTVTNARIFDEPVFNCTRDFPYLWRGADPADQLRSRTGGRLAARRERAGARRPMPFLVRLASRASRRSNDSADARYRKVRHPPTAAPMTTATLTTQGQITVPAAVRGAGRASRRPSRVRRYRAAVRGCGMTFVT